MSDIFVGDNDHGDAVPPTDVLLQMIKLLREDVVHFANELNEVTNQRDEARRMYCVLESQDIYHRTAGATCKTVANNLKWDCYKSVTESYEKILHKHHDIFLKLAQDENTNEN